MSLLSDLGTKIGTQLKTLANRLSNAESDITTVKLPYNLNQFHVGYRDTYYRAVIPLCEIDNTNISKFSYTSGRFDFIRTNGCCSQLPLHIEIKMQKAYNTANPMWFIMHNNLPNNIRPCKFTKNGQLYGGLEVYYDIQSHDLYFMGISTLNTLYKTGDIYWEYFDVRDNSIVDSEINNSLVIL